MARGIVEVTSPELEARWLASRIDAKLASGALTSIIVDDVPAKNPRFHGRRAHVVKVMTPKGQHIGTYHEIVMPDGTIPHHHPKDYTDRNCNRCRAPER